MKAHSSHRLSTLFLFLCTLLSVFITISGLISIKSLESFIFLLAYLPVTSLLLFTFLHRIFFKAPISVPLSAKKSELVFIIALVAAAFIYKLYFLL